MDRSVWRSATPDPRLPSRRTALAQVRSTCVHCAVVASSNAAADPVGARRLGNASIGVSVAGIVVTVVIIIIVVAVNVTVAAAACPYVYQGTCYRHKDYVGRYGHCSGVLSSAGYCYYNY